MTPRSSPRRPSSRVDALRPFLLAAAGALVVSCAAPAPPRPAPPPPPRAAEERAYIVFFEFGSTAIGQRGRQIIAEAARNVGGEGAAAGRRVELQAYADRAGSSAHNQRLSQRRAEAVAAELARGGVRRDRISIEAHGEGRPFVPTRDGAREGQNRGVWIVLR